MNGNLLNNMKKLSIIIPYYNTFDFTIKLIKELGVQITDEVEVILVDDGCNESRFDDFNHINVIHLDKNYGASYAWNIGIKASTGKYIAFIDSDDMIMMNYVDELIKAIDEDLADEIVFNWFDSTKNEVRIKPTNRSIWKAIYRREIVPLFNETWLCNTDVPFQVKLKSTEHSVYYLNKTLYCYNSNREGSITWRKKHGEFDKVDDK